MSAPPVIDGYTDLEQIARGGFGVVYRARQERFDRVVAIKVLSVMDLTERDRQRFDRECRAMGALSWHPNVVAVYDSGIADDGHPYLAMEFLDAGSLADHLANGVDPWPDTVRAAIQVAGALGAAHAAGTLHRDLKPENVLRGPFGEAKLGDFGIAAVEGMNATTTGHASLTVAHVAPEIMAGERPDERSDVYGLASTVHTLLAGSPPFAGERGEAIAALITRVLQAPAPRVEGVPDDLAELVQRTLSKDPGARPQTAEAFGRALQQIEVAHGLPRTELRLGATSGSRTADPVTPTRGDASPTIIGVATGPRPPVEAVAPVDEAMPSPAPPAPPAPEPASLAESAVAVPPEREPERPAPSPRPTARPTPTPPAKRSRRGLIVPVVGVLALVVLAAIVGMLLTKGDSGDEDVGTAASTAGGNGNGGEGTAEPAGPPVVTATVAVSPNPVGIAAVDDAIWVTHTVDAGTVTRIDPATDAVVTTIAVGTQPRGIAATSSAVWVANFDDGTVSRIDSASNAVVETIAVGGKPRGVAALDDVVWVTDFEAGTLLRIDPATNTVVATIDVGAEPVRVEATADDVWVTNNADDTVSRIDPATDTVVATIDVDDGPVSATITEGAVWVSNAEGGTVLRIDPATEQVVATIDLVAGVVFTAASADALWVANQIEGTLSRITLDDDEVTDTIPIGDGSTGVALADGAVWVTSTGSDSVSRVEPDD